MTKEQVDFVLSVVLTVAIGSKVYSEDYIGKLATLLDSINIDEVINAYELIKENGNE